MTRGLAFSRSSGSRTDGGGGRSVDMTFSFAGWIYAGNGAVPALYYGETDRICETGLPPDAVSRIR